MRTTANYEDLFRIGEISAVYPERHRVRVKFADKDGLVSDELPVLVVGSLKNKAQCLPDEGELVLCAFLPSGEEAGFVLGSFYSEADLPLSNDRDEYVLKIPGGGCIAMHRKNHTITLVDYHGSKMVWKNGNITLKSAANIYLNPDGDVPVPAHISAQYD